MAENPYIQVNPVAWYTIAKKVYQLTRETLTDAATYRITVKAIDNNDPNSGTIEDGFYFKDFIGTTYTILSHTSTTIDVEDSFRRGFAPTAGRIGIVYRSIDNNSPFLAGIFYKKLSPLALEYSRQLELAVLWNKEQKPVFNGVCTIPTITDNGDGSVTIGNNGHYHLAIIENGHDSATFLINGGTFILNNLQQNYIVANYNSGSPVVQHITDVTLINETTIVPIYSIFRNGNFLHIQNWDTLGLALANKVHQSIVKTQRYRREYGLILTESGTRNLNLTAGRVWVGAVPVLLDAIATSTDNLFFWYHSAGVWTVSVQTQYNNTQYDDGTNLVTLTSNRYAVNWVFRGVESNKHLYVVVGTGDYTLNQAQAATVPTLPPAISSHAVLVSKIIVQNGSNAAVSIQSAFDTQFSAAPTANHSDLTNLAWTSSGHTGTANKLAGFGSGGESIYVDPIVNTDEKVKYDAADTSAGYLSEKIVAGTNITIEEGTGADENKLKISSTGGGSTTYLGLTDTSDTTYTGKDKYVPMVDEPNSELDLTPTVLATLLKLDGPTSYVGSGGYSVKIKQTLDGFEFLPDGMNQISPSTSVEIPNNYSKIVADELVLSSTVDLTIVGSGSLTII